MAVRPPPKALPLKYAAAAPGLAAETHDVRRSKRTWSERGGSPLLPPGGWASEVSSLRCAPLLILRQSHGPPYGGGLPLSVWCSPSAPTGCMVRLSRTWQLPIGLSCGVRPSWNHHIVPLSRYQLPSPVIPGATKYGLGQLWVELHCRQSCTCSSMTVIVAGSRLARRSRLLRSVRFWERWSRSAREASSLAFPARSGRLTSVCCGRGLTPRPTRCRLIEARAGLGRPRRRNARR